MTLIYYGAGILFCAAGLYYFFRNLFEKEGRLLPAILLLVMGVILIAYGAGFSLGMM